MSERFRLSARIIIAVAMGVVAGDLLGERAAVLGELGGLLIRLLKALAGPLIFLAIVDAFVQTPITGRQALRLVTLSAINASVAVMIGLGVARTLHAGERWNGQLDRLLGAVGPVASNKANEPLGVVPPHPLVASLEHYLPESLLDPFLKNNVIGLVLLAVAVGLALRHRRAQSQALIEVVTSALGLFRTLMEWLIQLVPVAVFAVIAKAVGTGGSQLFSLLGLFVLTIVVGFILQGGLYYSIVVRFAGGLPWRLFWRGASEPLLTALSTGSSLATLPVTLRNLDQELEVSPEASGLAACVGTNLNHDGIILYEAAAALFVAQAFGLELSVGQQVSVAIAAVMAGVGIAGVPDAGLITLPLVLSAAGLPEGLIATVLPLLLSVDWLVGRGRAAVNVLSDMTVAVVLHRLNFSADQRKSATLVSETR